MDQELADAAAYALGRGCVCTHQMAPLFYLKWRHRRHLEHMTSYQKSDYIVCRHFNLRSAGHSDLVVPRTLTADSVHEAFQSLKASLKASLVAFRCFAVTLLLSLHTAENKLVVVVVVLSRETVCYRNSPTLGQFSVWPAENWNVRVYTRQRSRHVF